MKFSFFPDFCSWSWSKMSRLTSVLILVVSFTCKGNAEKITHVRSVLNSICSSPFVETKKEVIFLNVNISLVMISICLTNFSSIHDLVSLSVVTSSILKWSSETDLTLGIHSLFSTSNFLIRVLKTNSDDLFCLFCNVSDSIRKR